MVSRVAAQLQEIYGSKGFEERTTRRMVKFARTFPDLKILTPLVTKLAWTHFLIVMSLKEHAQIGQQAVDQLPMPDTFEINVKAAALPCTSPR